MERRFKGKSIVALPEDFVIVDTETTGLDYDSCEIIEVAAIRYRDGNVEEFSSLIRPCRPLNYKDGEFVEGPYVNALITDLTGITNGMLAEAPLPDEVMPRFAEFIGDAILIGHNISFDVNFLYAAMEKYTNRHLSNNHINTMRLARKIVPGLAHYRLGDVAAALDVEPDQAHRALGDCKTTLACYLEMRKRILEQYSESEFCDLFKKMCPNRTHKENQNQEKECNHMAFNAKGQSMHSSELHKSINTLRGIIAGMTSDGTFSEIEATELVNWCALHENLRNNHPFSELLPVIDAALADGVMDSEERQDILWFCSNFVGGGQFYDVTTANMQFLFGLIHGVLADGILSDREIKSLQTWLDGNSFLHNVYPFCDIRTLIVTVLEDGVITDAEREELTACLSNYIEFKDSYNLAEPDYNKIKSKYSTHSIYANSPQIDFQKCTFVFSGEPTRGTKDDLARAAQDLGGIVRSSVSSRTDYLVVGDSGNSCWAYSCYGRKVETALNLQKGGANVLIIKESDFWAAVDAAYAL